MFIAPLAALSLSLLGLIVTIYAIILICWPFHRNVIKFAQRRLPQRFIAEMEEDGGKIPCWTLIFGGLKLIYGHQVDELEAPGKPTIYSICGRHVRSWLLAVLFMVIIFVCTCTAVAFWNEFLVEQSQTCDSQMDCFGLDLHTYSPLYQEPLANCTDFESMDNVTISCYKFVFNYASALGNAGGVLVLASVIMNIQAGLWISASNQQGKCAWHCSVVSVAAMNIIIVTALCATPFIINFVPLFKETVWSTNRGLVQFFTYWSTFLSAFIFSGPILTIFSKRLRRETCIDGEELYQSVNSSIDERGRGHFHSASNKNSELEPLMEKRSLNV